MTTQFHSFSRALVVSVFLTVISLCIPPQLFASGYLHTDGNKIKNASGQTIILRGVNTYVCIQNTPTKFNKIAASGFNVVRLALWKNAIEGAPSGPCVGKNGLQEIDKAISYAKDAGLMIILDHHRWGNDIENAPLAFFTNTTLQQEWLDMWQLLIRRYQNEPTVIGIDIMNEPWAITGQTPINKTHWEGIAKNAYNTLHPLNPNLIIFISGWGMATQPMWSDLEYLKKPNLALSDHVYKERSREFLTTRYQAYLNAGIPIWLGEIGFQSSETSFMESMLDFYDELALHYTIFVYGVTPPWSTPFEIADSSYNLTSIGQRYLAHLSSPPPATPSPSPKRGDLNSDGKVDLLDFNLLVIKFGNPYTIFDFNNIVFNFGK